MSQRTSQRRNPRPEQKSDFSNPAKSYSRYQKAGASHGSQKKKPSGKKKMSKEKQLAKERQNERQAARRREDRTFDKRDRRKRRDSVSDKRRRHEARKNRTSRRIGFAIVTIQLLASLVFMAFLYVLDMLPLKWFALVGGILGIFLLFAFLTQWTSKKNAIAGKLFSLFMTAVLIAGSYYVGIANGAVKDVFSGGEEHKIDKVVVAVLADDKAEEIGDAKDYNFGVQYRVGGEDVQATIEDINAEISGEITTTEFESIPEQAQALHDGKVDAIIYNDGYTGILEESFEGYSHKVKVIYSHNIKKTIEGKSQQVEAVTQEPFTVYMSGIDVYGPIETNSRSDVNILATVNPKTHQVLLITTPRDYYVTIPGVSGKQRDKLTHAGIYGVDTSMSTLENIYKTEVDFYLRVNFTSFMEIIDTLGGLDVNSEFSFKTSKDSGKVFQVNEGMNSLNGEEALAFARERQNLADGDNQRGKNQQAVITAFIKKMVSPQMLMKANGIVKSVSGNVDTNITQDQIQALIKMQLNKGGNWNIYSVAAEGTGASKTCYSSGSTPLYVTIPDEQSVTEIQTLIDRVEQGEIIEGSETTTEG